MAIRNALSANYIDVNNAVNGGGPFVGAAADGDIVNIPETPVGGVTWDTKLTVNNAITLKGDADPPTPGSKLPGTIRTIIKDGIQTNQALINWNMKLGNPNIYGRLTGLEFQSGGGLYREILLRFSGTNQLLDSRFRWDNCRWNSVIGHTTTSTAGCRMQIETVVGVADHIEVVPGDGLTWAFLHHTNWKGPSYNSSTNAYGQYSDGSFEDDIVWGSADWFFFENCTFSPPVGKNSSIMCDMYQGSRYVFRHCLFDKAVFGSHGTETGGGRARGMLAIDVYNNTFNVGGYDNLILLQRSGSSRWHDNTYVGFASTRPPKIVLQAYRTTHNFAIFGGADGKNALDINDHSHGGTNNAPTPVTTGTVVSANNTTHTLSVSGNPYIADALVNSTIVRDGDTGVHNFSRIIFNTTNSITWAVDIYSSGSPPWLVFNAADTFKIYKPTQAFDQPGRTGGNATGSATTLAFPGALNNQITDPCYEWNNTPDTMTIGSGNVSTGSPIVVEGVHYFNGHLSPAERGDTSYDTYTYPHPLTGGVAVPNITSVASATFTAGTGGTFQVTDTGFTSSPTYSKTTSGTGETFPASGTTFSAGGLLTVGVGSAAGVYDFTIHAVNGSESDTQSFRLTITAAPTKVIALSGSLAFGDVDINTTSQKNLTITNTGNTTLTVTSITLPSGFTADWTSGTILPSATHVVVVTFSPIAGASYSGTVTVASDKTSGTNTIAASGVGVTRIIALTGTLTFGDITVGQTATRQMTISNSGNRALTVSSIIFPTDFSGNFVGTIAAGGSQIVNVTFSPTADQAYSDVITVVSNKTSGTNTRAVTGNGVATATAIIQLTGSLDFGSIQTGTTLDLVLTITNGGDTTLNVSGITYPTGFTGSYAGAIAPGASHNVTVTFSPVANTTYSGTVTVASDATGGTDTTTASGTGVAPATAVIGLSGSMAFGNVVIGSTSTRTLTIANTGSIVLNVSSLTLPSGFTGSFSGAINPSASQDVVITFSPLLNQSYDGTITVNSDKTSGTETIAVTGSGVQPTTRVISVSGNLDFVNVQKNHTVKRPMTIANSGTDNLVVSAISVPTGFSVDWTSGTIAPGAIQTVNVTFAPTNQQAYGGTITVTSDKTAGTNTIACSGNGKNKRQVPFFLIVS